MAQNITSFFERAVAREFSRDFLFRIGGINLNGFNLTEEDLVYAKSGTIPNRSLENVTAPYMGLQFNLPGKVTYDNSAAYSISFYCDASSELHSKLLRETERVFSNAGTGEYNMAGRDSVITLEQIDKSLSPVRTIKLIGASIRSCGQLQYNIAEGTGTVVSFDSTFAYHFYEAQ